MNKLDQTLILIWYQKLIDSDHPPFIDTLQTQYIWHNGVYWKNQVPHKYNLGHPPFIFMHQVQ